MMTCTCPSGYGSLRWPCTAHPAPIETAPKVEGTRILAFCKAAESAHGWAELVFRNGSWQSVIDHPYTNACLLPSHWMHAPRAPDNN